MATIGELTNVPEPGAPLQSQWAQDATNRIVHRYASKAALDVWAAPVGTYAQTLDDGMLWRRYTGGWSHQLPRAFATIGVVLTQVGALLGPMAQITVPPDPAPRTLSVVYRCYTLKRAEPGDWALKLNGTQVAAYRMDNTAATIGAGDTVHLLHGAIQLAAGATGVVHVDKAHWNYVTFADPNFHLMTVTATPGTVTTQVTPVPP